MIIFKHATDELEKSGEWHRWPFVYLHGEAEWLNIQYSEDNSSAPDICLANVLISEVLKCDLSPSGIPVGIIEDTFVHCQIDHKGVMIDAVLALSTANGMYGGRVALIRDQKGIQHVYNPKDWR
jgi:hypothetical protein